MTAATEVSTPHGRDIPSLDGIRAVCIIMVLGAHAIGSEGFPESAEHACGYLFNGGLGVLVFFVLSGFLITGLLIREESSRGRVDLMRFYIRRSLRILPVFWGYLAALAVLDALTNVKFSACEWLTSLTFTKNYGCGQWLDGHLWSLSVEEQFYLFWPAVIAVTGHRGRLVTALGLVAAAPIFRVLFHANGLTGLKLFSLMTNADALMFGCLAAFALARHPVRCRMVLSWRPALGRFVAIGAIYGTWMLQKHFLVPLMTVPLTVTVQSLAAAYLIASYSTIRGGAVYQFLNAQPVRFVGVLSYSLYVWQQVALTPPGVYEAAAPWHTRFPVNIAVAALLAVASYWILEKPFAGLRKRMRPPRASSIRPDRPIAPGCGSPRTIDDVPVPAANVGCP